MSKTITVTPYDSTGAYNTATAGIGLAAACLVGTAVGAVSIARWLIAKTPEDRVALNLMKEERRRDRLDGHVQNDLPSPHAESPHLISANLHLRDPESLVRSAEKIGYRLDPMMRSRIPLSEQPHILLCGTSGERLAIQRNDKGGLVVHTVGDGHRIQTLVRRHTLDRAVEHLTRTGMQVRTATLPNGEVQILAREQITRHGETAEVKTQINRNGTAWVDVSGIRGNRCEEIVSELAQAVEGEVCGMVKKDAYYQFPGEPTKTRLEV